MSPRQRHGAAVVVAAALVAAGPALAALGPQRRLEILRPAESVLAIAQTPDRYLWLGTHAGLLRYDGVTFTSFDRSNTPELELDRVSALVVDGAGALWVGLNGGGVVVRRGERWQRTPGVEATDLSALAIDGQGDLWAGTRDGLFRFDGKAWTRRGVPPALAHEPIAHLRAGPDGAVWVQGTTLVGRVVPQGFVSADPADAPPRSWARALIAGLLGTGAGAAELLNAAPLASTAIRTRAGELWLGGTGGLIVRGAGGLTRFDVSSGLPDDKVTALFEDHEGTVWVGTMAGGLVKVQRSVATAWSDGPGAATFAVVEAQDGAVWAASVKGVTRASDGRFVEVPLPDGVPRWSVRTLAATGDGAVAMGTLGHGIVQVKNGRARVFSTKDGLPSDEITAVLGARDGTVWAGAPTGDLVRVAGDRVEIVALGARCGRRSPGDAACPETPVALLQRRDGALVAGTLGAGLMVHEQGGVRRLATVDGVPAGMITALHEDASGALWIGTDGNGLARLAGGTVSSFSAIRDLPRRLYGLLEDTVGRLWMCSDRGVFRVSRAGLERFAAGGAAPPVSRFGTNDGMPSEQCHRYQPVGWRARDGRLLFATFQGVAVFTPPESEAPPPPPVVLERVLLDGRAFDPRATAAIDAGPGAGVLEFHYTAPTFVAVQRVRFRYRLEGFDGAWVDAAGRRAAYYTNIPPGRYRFVVQALRDDGAANATSAGVAFRLRPRFTQTTWFRASLGLIAVALLVAAYLLRRQLHRTRAALVGQERSRIALDLHDNLAQVFSALGFQIDSLQKLVASRMPGDESAPARLRALRETAAHARVAARNAIFNLRWQGQERRALADALGELARVYPDAAITVATRGAPRALPLGAENELLHVAQEATSNAIQHGRAARVTLDLLFDGARVELWIRDDGVGFDPGAADGRGAGIPGMRERARRAGGTLVVESTPGAGSAIGVVIDAIGKGSE